MPFTDMLGEPVLFAEHNWARLVSVSSFIRAAEAWGGAQLDVPRAFLCAVVAALAITAHTTNDRTLNFQFLCPSFLPK